MRLRRKDTTYTAPEGYPELTELQVGMLTKIADEQLAADMLYGRLMREHVMTLPHGVPAGPEGRRAALYLAQRICGLQRLVASTGPLFLPTLPTELNPGAALARLSQTAYACAAIAASDGLSETIPSIEERHGLGDLYGHEWHRTVNMFDSVKDERLGELLAEAGEEL